MAYHHHHHVPPQPTAASPSCYCCYPSTQTHHLPTPPPPPPPQLSLPNPLLVDAIISRLLHINSYQTPRKPQTHQSYQHYRPLGKTPDFSSLIDRIEALEASLHRFSFSTGFDVSVRDVAARIIQRHFRAFLVRRSRVLRQLQDLAVVKSSYAALRSSVSNSSYVRFEQVYRKVDDLLLQLDSIEEDDPMISNGKRSISNNLDRFLRYVDSRRNEVISSRRNNCRRTVSSGGKDNVRLRAQREMVNDLRGRVERIQKMSRVLDKEERANDKELKDFDDFSDLEEKNGRVSVIKGVQSLRNGGVHGVSVGGDGMKKNVKFAENGDAYRVISNSDEHSSIEGGDDSSDDCMETLEKFKKIELKSSPNDEEEGQEDSGGSYPDGGHGGLSGRRARKEGGSGTRREHHGPRYVFTPPVPEKMESVSDSMMKKKEVKL